MANWCSSSTLRTGSYCGWVIRTSHLCRIRPRELVSDSDWILGSNGVDVAFGDLRDFAVNLEYTTRRHSALQNVVVAEVVSRCYNMSPADTTVCELFALTLHRNSPGSDAMFGLSRLG